MRIKEIIGFELQGREIELNVLGKQFFKKVFSGID